MRHGVCRPPTTSPTTSANAIGSVGPRAGDPPDRHRFNQPDRLVAPRPPALTGEA